MRSMVAYGSFLDATRDLPPEAFKEAWIAILDYGIDGEEPGNLSTIAKVVYEMAKPNVDANKRRRKQPTPPLMINNCEQLSTIANNCEHKLQSSIDGDVDVNVNVDKKHKRFTPPTVDEVAQYIREKNYHFDAEEFVAFYSSKGWMIGKSKMTSWKQACVTWEKRRKTNSKAVKFEQHNYDFNEIDRALLARQM